MWREEECGDGDEEVRGDEAECGEGKVHQGVWTDWMGYFKGVRSRKQTPDLIWSSWGWE